MNPDPFSDERAEKIGEIAERFLAQLMAGAEVNSLLDLVEAHPDLAPDLEQRLRTTASLFELFRDEQSGPPAKRESAQDSGQESAQGLAHESAQPSMREEPVEHEPAEQQPAQESPAAGKEDGGASKGSASQPTGAYVRERAIRLSCPHCGVRFQVVKPDSVSEVTCSGCGSTIQVETEATESLRAALKTRRIGRFEIISILGHGGFGAVYKARDPKMNRIVAVKIPRSGYLANPDERRRFAQEARLAARLRHPNIVPVHDMSLDREPPFIVNEFIDGFTLDDYASRRQLEFNEIADLMATIAGAVHFAHTNDVFHRDIKPSNILLDLNRVPYVADFGLARDAAEITITIDGELLGTPAYMSPEQARGQQDKINAASDVFSLGVVLYRLLTGELPFRGSKMMMIHQVCNEDPQRPRSLNDHIPRNLETIALKAMAKEPEKRYPTAAAFEEDLQRFRQDRPILASPPSLVEQLSKWRRRNPKVAALSLIVLLLSVTIIAVSSWGYINERGLRQAADESRQASQVSQHRLLVRNGEQQNQNNDPFGALLWFSRALGSADHADEAESVERLRVGLILNQTPTLKQVWPAGGNVLNAQFSPSGRRVAVFNDNRQAIVFDAESGVELAKPFAHEDESDLFRDMSFDLKGRRLMITTLSAVHVWDVETSRKLVRLEHDGIIFSAIYSPDGRRIATSGEHGKTKIWDAASHALLHTIDHGPRHVPRTVFSPDSKRLLTVTTAAPLDENGNVIPITGPMRFTALDPNGLVRVFATETAEQVTSVQHDAKVTDVAFSRTGEFLFVADKNRQVHVWRTGSGEPAYPPLQHQSPVRRFHVTDDELITIGIDGQTTRWNPADGERLSQFTQRNPIVSTAATRDGNFIAFACSNGGVQIHFGRSGVAACGQLVHGPTAISAAFHPNGRILLTAGNDGSVKLWDLAGLAPQIPLLVHQGGVTEGHFSPVGDHVITSSRDNTARIWHARTGQAIGAVMQHGEDVLDCAVSVNGRYVATASADKTTRLWNANTGAPLSEPQPHAGIVLRVDTHPTKPLWVASDQSGTALLHQLDPPLVKQTFTHGSQIRFVRFSPDGDSVVAASFDGDVRVWSALTGKSSISLTHTAPVPYCDFDARNPRLLTACRDGLIRVWDLRDLTKPTHSLQHSTDSIGADFGSNDTLLSLDENGQVNLWRSVDGEYERQWQSHFKNYLLVYGQLAESQGLAVVCGRKRQVDRNHLKYGDGAAFLVDLKFGRPVGLPILHFGDVQRARFSPDGKSLLTVSADNSARITPLTRESMPQQELDALAQLLSGRMINDALRLEPLGGAEQVRLFQRLREEDPKRFRCTAVNIQRWKNYLQWLSEAGY